VRAAAQIDELALAVQRELLVGRDGGDDLRPCNPRPCSRKKVDGLVARHDLALHADVLLGQRLHARLDALEILGGEGALVGEVVIEAVVDDRTDGDLGLGEQVLHGLRQQVRGAVADDLHAVLVAGGDDGELRIGLDAVAGIHQATIHSAGERGLGQARADGLGHLVHRHRTLEILRLPSGSVI
jgi:hypothetical protein